MSEMMKAWFESVVDTVPRREEPRGSIEPVWKEEEASSHSGWMV